MNNIDITKMSEVELKALAYDFIGQLENCQVNIRAINTELLKRKEDEKKSKVLK